MARFLSHGWSYSLLFGVAAIFAVLLWSLIRGAFRRGKGYGIFVVVMVAILMGCAMKVYSVGWR